MFKMLGSYLHYFRVHIGTLPTIYYIIAIYIFAICCLLFFYSSKKFNKSISKSFLYSYLWIAVSMTIIERPVLNSQIFRMTLIRDRQLFSADFEYQYERVKNIVMAVPFGFLFPQSYIEKYKFTLLIGILLFTLIEFLQVLFRRGIFEIADIIDNIIGCEIGFVVYVLFNRKKREFYENKTINQMREKEK